MSSLLAVCTLLCLAAAKEMVIHGSGASEGIHTHHAPHRNHHTKMLHNQRKSGNRHRTETKPEDRGHEGEQRKEVPLQAAMKAPQAKPEPESTKRLTRAVDEVMSNGFNTMEEMRDDPLIDRTQVISISDSLVQHSKSKGSDESAPADTVDADSADEVEYREYDEMVVDNLCESSICKDDSDCAHSRGYGCVCGFKMPDQKAGCFHCHCQADHGAGAGCHPRSPVNMCAR